MTITVLTVQFTYELLCESFTENQKQLDALSNWSFPAFGCTEFPVSLTNIKKLDGVTFHKDYNKLFG